MTATTPRLVSITTRQGETLSPSSAAGHSRQTPSQRAELRAFAERMSRPQDEAAHKRALALMDAFDDAAEDDDALWALPASPQQPAGMMTEELPTRRNPPGPQATRLETPDQSRERTVMVACCAALALILVVAAVLA